jgi:hypothetical protein
MRYPAAHYFSLFLYLLFITPYLWKLRQVDLISVLLVGLVLPIFELYRQKKIIISLAKK